MTSGKLIVLYGINNLGKTTQAKLLVEKLRSQNLKAEYLKYPLYDLEPSGPLINDYLRQDNPFKLSAREAQLLYTMNRWQYQETLKHRLESGEYIIAEDYTGTGMAWGLGAGVAKNFLLKINEGLLIEDLAILFQGERFLQAVEDGHRHENDDSLTKTVDLAHQELAKTYGWHNINANNSIETIAEEIWQIVSQKFIIL